MVISPRITIQFELLDSPISVSHRSVQQKNLNCFGRDVIIKWPKQLRIEKKIKNGVSDRPFGRLPLGKVRGSKSRRYRRLFGGVLFQLWARFPRISDTVKPKLQIWTLFKFTVS